MNALHGLWFLSEHMRALGVVRQVETLRTLVQEIPDGIHGRSLSPKKRVGLQQNLICVTMIQAVLVQLSAGMRGASGAPSRNLFLKTRVLRLAGI